MSAMTTVFVDTSALVAAENVAGGDLYAATLSWLDWLWRHRSGRTGNQALVEFYDQVTTAALPMPQGDARAAIAHPPRIPWRWPVPGACASRARIASALRGLRLNRHALGLHIAAAAGAGCRPPAFA